MFLREGFGKQSHPRSKLNTKIKVCLFLYTEEKALSDHFRSQFNILKNKGLVVSMDGESLVRSF